MSLWLLSCPSRFSPCGLGLDKKFGAWVFAIPHSKNVWLALAFAFCRSFRCCVQSPLVFRMKLFVSMLLLRFGCGIHPPTHPSTYLPTLLELAIVAPLSQDAVVLLDTSMRGAHGSMNGENNLRPFLPYHRLISFVLETY